MYKRKAVKDVGRETSQFYRRVVVAIIVVAVFFLLLVVRQFKLQVLEHERFQTQSENNRIRIRPIPPVRGLIFDRNGILLAENRSIFNLEIVPEQVDDLDVTLNELKSVLTISDEQIESFSEQVKFRPKFKSYAIKSKLTEQEVAIFSANEHRFGGVSVKARLERYYPHGAQLVHVLGRMGAITKKELESFDQEQTLNYAATLRIGKLGLERFYESRLHGVVGSEKVETDVRGRVVRVLERVAPISGQDIYLNLDLPLQQAATKALNEVQARGAVVAVDPSSGGVLAMVSLPAYDPNMFTGGISSANYNKLLTSERPLFNRAAQGTYSPASTIKPHLAWLGLSKGVISEQTRIADPGWFSLPDNEHKYRDWRPYGHAPLMDVFRSVVESCDTFFYDLAIRLGINTISEGMAQFGFSTDTGLDIIEEKKGILPSREWKKTNRNESWYMGDTVNIGIGQGFWTVTPLQLANSVATIANDGVRYHLQLADKFSRGDEQELNYPIIAAEQIDVLDGIYLQKVKDAMHQVTLPPLGTAKTAFAGAHYKSAGKTGTAQLKSIAQDEEYDAENLAKKYHDNALFVGYAPFDKPQIALAVVMENAGGGGGNAAPIARTIMDAYLNPSKAQEETNIQQQEGEHVE